MKISLSFSLCRVSKADPSAPPENRFALSDGSFFQLSDGSFFVLEGF